MQNMQKLKPLIPSMRERKRYLAYEIISKESLKKDISSEMIKLVNKTLGLFDSAQSGILSVEYDQKTQKGLLKVNNKMTDKKDCRIHCFNSNNRFERNNDECKSKIYVRKNRKMQPIQQNFVLSIGYLTFKEE